MYKNEVAVQDPAISRYSKRIMAFVNRSTVLHKQTNFLHTLRHVHLHTTAHVTDHGRTTKETHSQKSPTIGDIGVTFKINGAKLRNEVVRHHQLLLFLSATTRNSTHSRLKIIHNPFKCASPASYVNSENTF